jgi:hypothetical protein
MRERSKVFNKILLGAALLGAGFYWFVLRLPGDAVLSNMVPGADLGLSKLECWLTLEFKRYPSSDEVRDLEVVFSSEALHREQRFDWEFIAENDFHAGDGLEHAEYTDPEGVPPLGRAIKVKFPLRARQRIQVDNQRIPLTAEIYWGGVKQDKAERALSHVYHPDI